MILLGTNGAMLSIDEDTYDKLKMYFSEMHQEIDTDILKTDMKRNEAFLQKVKSKEFRIKQSRKRWKIHRGIIKVNCNW